MRGSGIDSDSWSGEMYCPTCKVEVEVEGETNDSWTMAYANCPECGGDLSKDIDTSDDYEE